MHAPCVRGLLANVPFELGSLLICLITSLTDFKYREIVRVSFAAFTVGAE